MQHGRRPVYESLENRVVLSAVTNPVSAFPVVVDGQFTAGVINVNVALTLRGEWSDITPLAFHSPTSPVDTFHATTIGTADANSLLYAGLDPGADQPYLLYDHGAGLQQTFPTGGSADVTFPLLQTNPNGSQIKRLIDVKFQIAPQSQGSGAGTILSTAAVSSSSATVTFEASSRSSSS